MNWVEVIFRLVGVGTSILAKQTSTTIVRNTLSSQHDGANQKKRSMLTKPEENEVISAFLWRPAIYALSWKNYLNLIKYRKRWIKIYTKTIFLHQIWAFCNFFTICLASWILFLKYAKTFINNACSFHFSWLLSWFSRTNSYTLKE